MYRMLSVTQPTIFTQLADKYKARDRIKQLVGDKYLVNLLHVYSKVEDIDFSALPEQFVLKCNHDCGSVVVCDNKENLDKVLTINKLRFFMKRNQYYVSREWQYRDITPKVICEEFVDLSGTRTLGYRADMYRVHCFNGKPKWLEVEYTDVAGKRYTCIYDTSWALQPVLMRYPNTRRLIPAPLQLPELLYISGKLTFDIDYCRVDFYLTHDRILFSEFTFAPSNGREIFTPQIWDYKFGVSWEINSTDQKPTNLNDN
ncbi:ATP-grasp fold amidoligase family protein [Rahnella sp. PAMC 25559]|uniref:ATP-grasp fold amidoligase family protein n=1 Tax=Rahnella sp. PAMC 25559 TaxID=3423225 RepID=UPI003D66B301